LKISICAAGNHHRDNLSLAGGVHPSKYEMLSIISGKARFFWNGRSCLVEAPALFLLAPSIPHQLESISPEIKYRFLEIIQVESPPLTDEQFDAWNDMQGQQGLYAKTVLASAILESFDWIYHFHMTGEARQYPDLEQACLLEVQKIYRLAAYLLSSNGFASSENANTASVETSSAKGPMPLILHTEEIIERLIHFMEWRYKEEITLAALAELVHLNPSYLIRLFKKQMNVTPFDYLRDLRLKAAISLLSGSMLSVQEIAHETGFGSVHYFCRLFKRSYGSSPAEWRKQLKKGPGEGAAR